MKYLTLFILLFLTACKQEEVKNYSWYMQHPLELQKASQDCQSTGQGENLVKCEMIAHAVVGITAIISQLQQDPEKFGQRVLDAEEQLGTLSTALDNARDNLKGGNAATPAQLKLAQDQLDKAKKAYIEQEQEVKVYLAVIGLSSPE